MSLADLIEDTFPHSTIEGYQKGCRGRRCDGRDVHGFSCAEAMVWFRGEFGFRRLVKAGAPVGVLAEFVAGQRAAAVESDREEAKAARRAARGPREPKQRPVKRPARPRRSTNAERTTARPFTEAELLRLRELNGLEWNDSQIAQELGRAASSVSSKRRDMKLPRRSTQGDSSAPFPHGRLAGYQRGCNGGGCPSTPSCGDVGRAYWRKRHGARRAAARADVTAAAGLGKAS